MHGNDVDLDEFSTKGKQKDTPACNVSKIFYENIF